MAELADDRAAAVRGRITLEVPAAAEYVSVLRAAAGAVASRLSFSLDDIDDLRILVDEAASVLLSASAVDVLRCEIEVGPDTVWLTLRATLPPGVQPHGDGFAWNILQALANEVSINVDGNDHVVRAVRTRGPVIDVAR